MSRRPVPSLVGGVAVLLASLVVPLAGQGVAAGGGPSYVSTIGGPGSAYVYPSGLEVSAVDGSVVAADTGNDQVVKFARDGTELWRVGSSGSGVGQFGNPRDVGVDSEGNVYVADDANSAIEKLDRNGRWIAKWSGSALGFGSPIGISVRNDKVLAANAPGRKLVILSTTGQVLQTVSSNGVCSLSHIRDADIDSRGNIWIADYNNHRLAKFSAAGTCLGVFGGLGAGNGSYKYPYGVNVGIDPVLDQEVLFIADSANARIQEIALDGSYLRTIGVKGDPSTPNTLRSLRRVVQDPVTKDVWAADLWGFRLVRFVQGSGGEWTARQQIPSPPRLPPATDRAVFNEPRGIDVASNGTVTVMDTVNQRFEQFTPGGALVNTCGERGRFPGGNNWPRGLAVDGTTNHVWVADTKDSRINVIDPTTAAPGRRTCKVVATLGTRGAGAAQFDYLHSISIRRSDRIAFVADTNNNRIVAWDVASRKPVVGGTLGGFRNPRGIDVAPNGHVFVADTKKNRVVEVADNGNGAGLSVVRSFTTGLRQPEGVTVDGAGRVWVADTGNNRVVVFAATTGEQLATISSADGRPLSAPAALAYDGTDRVYIADTQNDRVVVFSWS